MTLPIFKRSSLLLLILTAACLLPFVQRAFHVDDPLFIWTARQIQHHPLDFYGFTVNWYGRLQPMAAVMENPPLASYYMAPAGILFGWNEIALHLWFLIPALAVILGTWNLAKSFCAHPFMAALLTLTAPVFLVSSTSVMCDTLMLAFWLWAVICWRHGVRQNRARHLFAAALLTSLCALTKYFGIALIPLLLVWTIIERKKISRHLVWLIIPAGALLAFQLYTRHLYGHGLITGAAAYALNIRVGGSLPSRLLTGLAFTGACMFALIPLARWLWRRHVLLIGISLVVLTGIILVCWQKIDRFSLLQSGQLRWFYLVQYCLAAGAGFSLLVLAARDGRACQDADSMLLLLWIFGTFCFASVVNWTVSARNILPLVPAAAILAVRRLEHHGVFDSESRKKPLALALLASLAVALITAAADYGQAGSSRDAARTIRRGTQDSPGQLWFEGHWGFQYYMEQLGGRPLDKQHLFLSPNDVIAVPLNNSYEILLSPTHVALWFELQGGTFPWLATMSPAQGAGYYSAGWGPLPYVFCHDPPDLYQIYRVH